MKHRAFTYLELLIALSLFSVGMTSVLKIFSVNRRYLSQSASFTTATFLAQEELESVRAATYASLTVMPAYYEPQEIVPGAPYAGFLRMTAVTYVDGSGVASVSDQGLKKVEVTVSWTENSASRTLVMATYARS